jgi:hypothetical protein
LQNPDQFSFQNNSFSITSLLKPKISIKIPTKSSTKSNTSPLPSPSPVLPSPTFPIIENNDINTITNRSRSLIFALTGLAGEEDKDLAFESGVDGFLTKPVSLKMLEKVLKNGLKKMNNLVKIVVLEVLIIVVIVVIVVGEVHNNWKR